MAEATSAAPLSMMRKTTSRKPKSAATISDFEMTWLPFRSWLAVQDDDRGARSSISNHRPVGDKRRLDSRTDTAAAPILVLLAAALAPPEAAGGAREQDGERMILGLSLIRRAVLAARRAGYRQVFVLSANADATAGAAEAPSWSRFAAASSFDQATPLVIAPAAILAETDWLERLAAARIEPAAWAAIRSEEHTSELQS